MARRICCTDRDSGTVVDVGIKPNVDGSALHVVLDVCDEPVLKLVMGMRDAEALRDRLTDAIERASLRRDAKWAPNRVTAYGREMIRIAAAIMGDETAIR